MALSTYESIQFEVNDRVAVITLNRPESLNAINPQMSAELKEAIFRSADDAEIGAVIITGAGRGFSSGEDLTTIDESTSPARIIKERYVPILKRMREMPKPVFAAVNGAAAGGGASLALACDIVYAAESASFTQAFVRIGLIPDAGGTYFLPRRVGVGRALEMALSGRQVRATEGEHLGLIDRVFPLALLMPKTLEMAKSIAGNPRLAVAATKELIHRGIAASFAEVLEAEAENQERLGHTEDFREGVAAFLAKRSPVFKG